MSRPRCPPDEGERATQRRRRRADGTKETGAQTRRRAYRATVTDDPELAAAVTGRARWEPVSEQAARYAPPGATLTVLVRRVALPSKRERYMATIQCDNAARSSRTCSRKS